MLLQLFHVVSRQVLQGPPASLPPEQAAAISSYSARRVLSAIADLVRYSLDDRVAWGCWLEAEANGLALRSRVPDLYSDSNLPACLQVKKSLVDAVRAIVDALGGRLFAMGLATVGSSCA